MNLPEYEIETIGKNDCDNFRIFFKKKLLSTNQPSPTVYISPLHDISLYSDAGTNLYHMIVEIPRWTNAKMEIAKEESFNPIKHEIKNNKLRYVDNCFPYHGYIWNYGSFPQTWQMPDFKDSEVEDTPGDNDPVDVIEIGSKVHSMGTVLNIKVLGGLAIIDNDKLDWKIIAIDINDPLASKLNDINDCYIYMPDLLETTIDWFRFSEAPTNFRALKFGFNDEYVGQLRACEVVEKSHGFWKNLIRNELLESQKNDTLNFKLYNTQCNDSFVEYKKTDKESELLIETFKQLILNKPIEAMAPMPSLIEIQQVHYVNKTLLLKNLNDKINEEKKIKEKDKIGGLFGKLLNSTGTNIILPIALSAFISYFLYVKLIKNPQTSNQ